MFCSQLQKYLPKPPKHGFFRSCHTRRLYGTKECWNRPGNLINRKYCSRGVDIDVQRFPRGDLVTNLGSSEVGTVGKRSDFPWISLWRPYTSTVLAIRKSRGNPTFYQRCRLQRTNFVTRSPLGNFGHQYQLCGSSTFDL